MNDYMNLAFEEAKKAFYANEVPVGAIIVHKNEIIAQSHNKKIKDNNVCSHAEILALIEATKHIGDWRLLNCDMYVTLEPCPMCAGAILNSRIRRVYIGSESNIKSNKNVLYSILNNKDYNHYVEIAYLNNENCSKILTDFFSSKR